MRPHPRSWLCNIVPELDCAGVDAGAGLPAGVPNPSNPPPNPELSIVAVLQNPLAVVLTMHNAVSNSGMKLVSHQRVSHKHQLSMQQGIT